MDASLAGQARFADIDDTALADSSVLAAALALHDVGEIGLFRRFLRHLAETATRAEKGAIADLALTLNQPHTAIYIGKYAAQSGDILVRALFPIPEGMDGNPPFENATVLSVARRESEFKTASTSRAGALGLMQLMPATARYVSRSIGLQVSNRALIEDRDLNLMLGAEYLVLVSQELDGYLPAVLAGYNAGPGRARQWLRAFGPADTDIYAAVDWIEAIPFTETRNYVMRVLEGRDVYRARLAGEPVHWSLGDILSGAERTDTRRISVRID